MLALNGEAVWLPNEAPATELAPSRKPARTNQSEIKKQCKQAEDLLKGMPAYLAMNLHRAICPFPPEIAFAFSIEDMQRGLRAGGNGGGSGGSGDRSSRTPAPQHVVTFLGDICFRRETSAYRLFHAQNLSVTKRRIVHHDEYEAMLNKEFVTALPYSAQHLAALAKSRTDTSALAETKNPLLPKRGLMDQVVLLTDGAFVFPMHFNTFSAALAYRAFDQPTIEWVMIARNEERWFAPASLFDDKTPFETAESLRFYRADHIGPARFVRVPSYASAPSSSSSSSPASEPAPGTGTGKENGLALGLALGLASRPSAP